MTPYEIGQLIAATAFGFSEPRAEASFTEFLDVAIAVALAESGGNANAVGRNSNGSTDNGLWQINSVHKNTFTSFKEGTHSGVNPVNLWNDRFNPTVNTVMAKHIYRAAGGSFSPWTGTYGAPAGSAGHNRYLKNRGHGERVHKQLLADKDNGIEQALGGGTIISLGTLADPSGDQALIGVAEGIQNVVDPISSAISKVLSFVKDGAITVGAFALGLILLLIGVWFIVSQTKAGKAVTNVVPATKVLK